MTRNPENHPEMLAERRSHLCVRGNVVGGGGQVRQWLTEAHCTKRHTGSNRGGRGMAEGVNPPLKCNVTRSDIMGSPSLPLSVPPIRQQVGLHC